MYTLKIMNNRGELYELTHNRQRFSILSVSGLTLPQCNINIISSAARDGGAYSSSHLNPRNIVITIALEGDIETNRQMLYTIFPLHSPVTVYYRTFNRDLYIDGYVETIDGSLFEQKEAVQIPLICPDPYWKSMYTLTAETSVQDGHPVCSVVNSGDADIGFHAVMRIDTEDPPPITLAKSTDSSLTAVYPYARNLFLRPTEGGSIIPYSTTLNKICEIEVDREDITAHVSDVDKITKKDVLVGDGVDYLHVSLDADCISSTEYIVSYVIISDSNGGSVENVQYSYDISTYFSDNPAEGIVKANIAFRKNMVNTAIDYYDVYMRTSSTSDWVKMDKAHYTLDTHGADYDWAEFDFSLSAYSQGKLVVYHDSTGADISATLHVSDRYVGEKDGTEWYFHCYGSIPGGYDSSKNVPYIDDERIENSEIADAYIFPDGGGTVETYSVIAGYIISPLTFSYVYSLSGDDISEYTDEQIEAGLAGTAFIHRITLRNTTTGEQLLFDSTRFQIGDVVDISTVPGSLQAKITERSGETANISLLYDAYQNGTFFKLQKGPNVLKITADAHEDYLSAEVDARQLYGGV